MATDPQAGMDSMTDETPAAALDLDEIETRRGRISQGIDANELHLDPACPARYAVMLVKLIDLDVPALLAEVERWRKVGRCFHRAPSLLGAPLTCTLTAGHAGAHSDGSAHWSPIMSAVAVDFEDRSATAAGATKEDADLFHAWARLNEIISPDRSRFDVLRDELPKCRTRVEAEALIRSEGFGERYPLLPEIDAEVPDRG